MTEEGPLPALQPCPPSPCALAEDSKQHALVVRHSPGHRSLPAPLLTQLCVMCLSLIMTNLHLVITTVPHLLLFILQVLSPCSVTLYILFMGIIHICVYRAAAVCVSGGQPQAPLLLPCSWGGEGAQAGL